MPSDDVTPCHLERVEVNAAKHTTQLFEVGAGFRSIQRMKQHTLLHGRESVQALDLSDTNLRYEPVQTRLVDCGEREVRRRITARVVRQAMSNQSTQNFQIVARYVLDRFSTVQV